MYELEVAIRDAIEYHLLGTQSLLNPAVSGDGTLLIGSTATLSPGDQIAIYDGEATEVLTICEIYNEQQIRVNPPVASDWTTSAMIQKLHEGELVQFVLQGNPPSIPRYPAITVECLGNDNEALTLGVGLFSQEFRLRVTVWSEKSAYADARKQVQKLASRIERALFRTVFPVVSPWAETMLVEDMEPEQNYIMVADGSQLGIVDVPYGAEYPPVPIYINAVDGRYPTQIVNQMGPNAFYIDRVFPRTFIAEVTTIIRPRVHVYDSFCDGITLDENRENLIYADVNYRAKVARIRYAEPFV